MTHYPYNGNQMLKASCGVVGMTVQKVCDPAKVTCPKCLAAMVVVKSNG